MPRSCCCLLPLLVAAPLAASDVATLSFTPGWATFGQVVPAGVATDGLAVGDLPTQCDIKNAWPDGSIRFAILTAAIPAAGSYTIHTATRRTGSMHVTAPTVDVQLIGDGPSTLHATAAGQTPDQWLSGDQVVEWRTWITPRYEDQTLHPFLRVVLDTRMYADGTGRADVTVENDLNLPAAGEEDYSIAIVIDGAPVWTHPQVQHPYLCRWRHCCPIHGFSAATPGCDAGPMVRAQAVPNFLTTAQDMGASGTFDILQPGALSPYFGTAGNRPEIAPYPDWQASFLAHGDTAQLPLLIAAADCTASFPVHLRNADGTLVSLDDHPQFWFDPRGTEHPAGGPTTSTDAPDLAHQASMTYIPYLLTGDRFDADEMAFWGNYCLLATWPDPRGGAQGILLGGNEIRGLAWGLRNIVDPAAYLPDTDPRKAYFTAKVANNLAALDAYAAQMASTPCGTVFEGQQPAFVGTTEWQMPAPWENDMVAWSIDHAIRQGLWRQSGATLRDRIVGFVMRTLTSPDEFDPRYASTYFLNIGTYHADSQSVDYNPTLRAIFEHNFGPLGAPTAPVGGWAGYWGLNKRLDAVIAEDQGDARAPGAIAFVESMIADDLTTRPGWSIGPAPIDGADVGITGGSTAGTTTGIAATGGGATAGSPVSGTGGTSTTGSGTGSAAGGGAAGGSGHCGLGVGMGALFAALWLSRRGSRAGQRRVRT